MGADVVGRYQRNVWRPPLWVPLVLVSLLLVAVIGDVVVGQPGRAVVPAVLGVAGIVATWRLRRQRPFSTEVFQTGVVVSAPARADVSLTWEQVVGVRVFSRRTMPQLVLGNGAAVQLWAVPDAVARSLAAQLPSVLGRPVWFEVDIDRADPTAGAARPPTGRTQAP